MFCLFVCLCVDVYLCLIFVDKKNAIIAVLRQKIAREKEAKAMKDKIINVQDNIDMLPQESIAVLHTEIEKKKAKKKNNIITE